MKNKRIIQAYDSINPSPIDKQRMLEVILHEANLEEVPRKNRQKKEPVIYTAKPTKTSRRSTIGAIAASFVIVLIAGFILMHMIQQPADISYTTPADPVSTGTSYDAVLNKYKTALEEGWSVEQCQIEDICGHITTTNYSALDVGYAILDLDGNGVDELVISNGQGLVWDLYTLLEDGTPVHVHSQEEGWPVYRLYENGIICAEDFDPGQVYEYYVYQDAAFTSPELVIRQDGSSWYYEPAGETPQILTAEEAEAKMAEYKLQEMNQTSLLSLVSEAVAEKYLYGNNTAYTSIIAKYNQAIADGWTKEQCEIEGISHRVQAGADVSKTGYAFLDLDGDGREELIIAEESLPHIDNIWDIYTTLEDGTPIQLWVDERNGGQCRLHEGNVLGISDSYQDEMEQTFYNLQNGKLVMCEMLQWKNEDMVFYTDAEGNTRQVTSREGQDISNAYDIQKLNLTWLADSPDYLRDTDSVERYTPVLEKYKTALTEGWDSVMCSENGLSFYTPIASEYESLYYAIYDLNGDSTSELIISEYPYREDTDTDFLEIYTVRNGSVEKIMIRHETEMRYLCEGGIVKDLTPPERGDYNAYVSFWEMNQEGLFGETGAVYEIDGQWYHGLRASEKITAAEAEAEVKDLKPLYLDFTEIKSAREVEMKSGYEVFDQVIHKYVTAIKEGWTEYQCEQNDISPQILSDTSIQHNLGWCLLDIDKNGVEELGISDGVHLFDLYVMQPHNGGPGHLICANGGETWQLCENGVIQNHGLYSGTSAWRYYTLVDIDMIQRDIVFYDGELNQYYYGSDGEDLNPISKDEAGDIISRNRTMELNLTPFVEAAPFEPDEMEYYNPLLDIYRQAIREKWNPGVCVENGISLMVGYYGDFINELGYKLVDLDGNGFEELIITDGTNIYDMYTIIEDEAVSTLHLFTAMERIEYFLTTEGQIYNLGSGSASVSYYMLYQLNGSQLDLQEGYMLDYESNPSAPWFYYDGVEKGDPCPHAAAATDAIHFEHIPFTSFE